VPASKNQFAIFGPTRTSESNFLCGRAGNKSELLNRHALASQTFYAGVPETKVSF